MRTYSGRRRSHCAIALRGEVPRGLDVPAQPVGHSASASLAPAGLWGHVPHAQCSRPPELLVAAKLQRLMRLWILSRRARSSRSRALSNPSRRLPGPRRPMLPPPAAAAVASRRRPPADVPLLGQAAHAALVLPRMAGAPPVEKRCPGSGRSAWRRLKLK